MTAACGGGTSGPNAVAQPVSYFVGSALVDMVATALELSEPWAAILGYAAGTQFDVSVLCATDPPAMPTFDAGDIFAIITSSAAESPSSFQKLHDLIQNGAWAAMCQCDSPPQPSAPTPPVYPTGAPVVNPTGYGTGSTGPCWTVSTVLHTVALGNFTLTAVDISDFMLPAGPVICTVPMWTGFNGNVIQLPPNATNFKLTVTPLSSTSNMYIRTYPISAACGGFGGTGDMSISFSGGLAPVTKTVAAMPSGTAGLNFAYSNENGGSTTLYEDYRVDFSFYCGSTQPGTPIQPCCPPDPTMLGILQQIQNELAFIYSNLPVRVPNYAASTAHAGVTGEGFIALAATTIAVLVVINTLPPSYGQVVGDPETYLDVGWLTPANNQGVDAGIRITRANQTFGLPEATSLLYYTLPPGEVITVTELQAG